MTVRLDADVKASFDKLCSEFGMSANTAMNVFARAVVQRGCIPFEIRSSAASASEGQKTYKEIRAKAESGELPDLTLDEINEEINLSRSAK